MIEGTIGAEGRTTLSGAFGNFREILEEELGTGLDILTQMQTEMQNRNGPVRNCGISFG